MAKTGEVFDLPDPVDPPVHGCFVLGTRIGYTVEGPPTGSCLVTVHGVPGGAPDFRYLAPLLAERLRVYRLELPGFGSNITARWHDYSPAGRARLIVAFADAMGIGRLTVAGHSLGGPAAIATAAFYPERTESLVLLSSIGLRRHRGMFFPPTTSRWMVRASHIPIVQHEFIRQARIAYKKIGFPNADRMTVEEFRAHGSNVASYDYARARAAAEAVQCPVLLAYAADDRQIENSISEELARAIPTTEIICYVQGGHNIQKTQARDLARQILKRLAPE